jgi:hypothetical protein
LCTVFWGIDTMAKRWDGGATPTQDQLHEANVEVDAGRKGGAVSAAPYREEGPLAGRGYDATAAVSEQSRLRAFIPVFVAAVVTVLLCLVAINFKPETRPQATGRIAPSTERPAGDPDRGRGDQGDQGLPGLKSGQ